MKSKGIKKKKIYIIIISNNVVCVDDIKAPRLEVSELLSYPLHVPEVQNQCCKVRYSDRFALEVS